VTADAELLTVAIEIMRAFRLTQNDVRARVSDRRLLRALLAALGVSEEQTPAVFAVMDKIERQPMDVSREKLGAAGLADGVVDRIVALSGRVSLDGLRAEYGGDPAVAERLDELARYFDYLAALGVEPWVDLDLKIVRGLAYYTGIVFELFDAHGTFRAICGGGRYDTLLKSLGGVDLPALGFGMGDVVLGELLRERGLMPATLPGPDFWLAYSDPHQLTDAMRLAQALRRSGSSVEYALRPQQLGRQLKAAAAAGAPEAVIVREDGTLILKSLASGEERTVRLSEGRLV
jgi:histidyl-tRNA synthetase